jgi:hypothetical protein
MPPVNGSERQAGPEPYQQSNSSININVSAIHALWGSSGADSMNISLKTPVNNILISGINSAFASPGPSNGGMGGPGFMLSHLTPINFFVYGNGTISMPSPDMMAGHQGPAFGYVLYAHSAKPFSYKGELEIGNSPLPVTIKNGGTYEIVVATNQGIVQTNVTS